MSAQEENEVIAAWAGIECRCEQLQPPNHWSYTEVVTWYDNCPRHSNGGNPPDYDRDEVAVSLLPLLVGKGYGVMLQDIPTVEVTDEKDWNFGIYNTGQFGNCIASTCAPTIAAAIKVATKNLLEIESGGIGEVDAAGN